MERLIKLGKIPTKVITYGQHLGEEPDKLILIIPGNPGVADFYSEFASYIYDSLIEDKYSVWVIGHSGHENLSQDQSVPCMAENPDLYDLQAQVNNKIEFIRSYIPKKTNLIIIGHSIGAKIAIEAHNHFYNERQIRSYLLCPVMERMYESPNGRKCYIQTSIIPYILILFVFILSCIPKCILSPMLKLWHGYKISSAMQDSLINYLRPEVVRKVCFMAKCELNEVKELSSQNIEFLNKADKNIRYYYLQEDDWCPLKYYYELKKKVNGMKAQVCKKGLPHDFVVNYSQEMTKVIKHWTNLDDEKDIIIVESESE